MTTPQDPTSVASLPNQFNELIDVIHPALDQLKDFFDIAPLLELGPPPWPN